MVADKQKQSKTPKQKAASRATKTAALQAAFQSGLPRSTGGVSVAATSRVSSILSELAGDPGKAYFRYVKGLVAPLTGGRIPDLTSTPSSWNGFSNVGNIGTDAGGNWNGYAVPRLTDMIYQAVGMTVPPFSWGAAGLTAGWRTIPQASAFLGLVTAYRITGLLVRIRPVASALNNSGIIAMGQAPVVAGTFSVAQITQLPSHVTKSVPQLATDGSIEMWIPTDNYVGATGVSYRFLDFQGIANAFNGSEPCVYIAIEGAAMNANAFTLEVEVGVEAITTNQILSIAEAAPSNPTAMGLSSVASQPAMVRLMNEPDKKDGFLSNPAGFLWDHRGDIAGAAGAVYDVAKSAMPYALPALGALAAFL